jgi:hypothetical protein
MTCGMPRRVGSKRAAYVSVVAFSLGLCAVIGIAALSITSAVIDRPVFGLYEWLPFFVLMFPLFGRAVLEMNRLAARKRSPTRSPRRFRASFDQPRGLPSVKEVAGAVPDRVLASLWVVGVLAVINFFVEMTMTMGLGGQPSFNARLHRYELNEHGSVTVVSRAVYEHAAAVSGRAFMGGSAVFLLLSMPITLNRWLLWKEGQGTSMTERAVGPCVSG